VRPLFVDAVMLVFVLICMVTILLGSIFDLYWLIDTAQLLALLDTQSTRKFFRVDIA